MVDGGARTPMALLKKRKQRSAMQRGPHVSSGTRAAKSEDRNINQAAEPDGRAKAARGERRSSRENIYS